MVNDSIQIPGGKKIVSIIVIFEILIHDVPKFI